MTARAGSGGSPPGGGTGGAGPGAGPGGSQETTRCSRTSRKRCWRYPQFTIFDDVSAVVADGVVTLKGKVTMPFKKHDIEKRVAKVPGVTHVENRIGVLPVSQFDDELRYAVARAIYGSSAFWHYASMVNPPIHIIVEGGRVTLTGRRRQQRGTHDGEVPRHVVHGVLGDERPQDGPGDEGASRSEGRRLTGGCNRSREPPGLNRLNSVMTSRRRAEHIAPAPGWRPPCCCTRR